MFGHMIKIKKLNPEAIVPTYAKKGDAGADLYSCEEVILNPGCRALISTGIAIAMPSSWVGLIHPRSGTAHKYGVTVLNSPGTIDSGYRGEVKVNLINQGSIPVTIDKGDRIAQVVFQRFEQADFLEVDELEATDRGENGHGSTGIGVYDGPVKE